jgi:hypothetical protein
MAQAKRAWDARFFDGGPGRCNGLTLVSQVLKTLIYVPVRPGRSIQVFRLGLRIRDNSQNWDCLYSPRKKLHFMKHSRSFDVCIYEGNVKLVVGINRDEHEHHYQTTTAG